MKTPIIVPLTNHEVVAKGAKLLGSSLKNIHADVRLGPIHRKRLVLYAALRLRAELHGRVPNFSQIARTMRRDHSTLLHGLRRADYLMEHDAQFMEDVTRVATLGMPGLKAPVEKPACNPPLQVLPEVDQQRNGTTKMAEYIEKQLNDALARAGAKNIAVYWDGEIVTDDEPATFRVFHDDEETAFWITDRGAHFEFQEETAPRSFNAAGIAHTHVGAATLLHDLFATAEKEDA